MHAHLDVKHLHCRHSVIDLGTSVKRFSELLVIEFTAGEYEVRFSMLQR